ncbi:ParB/RepB/Spo0J family partition protein [Sandaracinobacteroides sp. A072]|uniref:ParB/RepB/Spo0J family partition protein n=1 Tax=Sandaracinobacteroides sp. A072 TaxID=3461146 RepID=UPI0040425059
MAGPKKALGRGLSALLEEMGPGPSSAETQQTSMLPVALIQPCANQPRRQFEEMAMSELADSIRVKGVLQPILVRPLDDGRYEIVAGERRWRASQMAGLHEIPVVVRPLSDMDSFEAALIENVQRADLNPLEEAQGYQRLVREYGHTQEMVAALTGKARSHVANLMRLLDLPEEAQEMLKTGSLSVGHAKAIMGATDPLALARMVVERGLTVRQAEELARKDGAGRGRQGQPSKGGRPRNKDSDLEALEAQLSDALGVQVLIDAKGSHGTVSIRFSDLDQLDSIIARLQG